MNARFGGADGVFLPADAAGADRTSCASMQALGRRNGRAGSRAGQRRRDPAVRRRSRSGARSCSTRPRRSPATAARRRTRGSIRAPSGTFPRVLGRYVRETKALTWEDAVRKMTALPATHDRHVDRGFARARHGGRRHGLRSRHGDRSRDLRGRRRDCRKASGSSSSTGVIALRDGKVTGDARRPRADAHAATCPAGR